MKSSANHASFFCREYFGSDASIAICSWRVYRGFFHHSTSCKHLFAAFTQYCRFRIALHNIRWILSFSEILSIQFSQYRRNSVYSRIFSRSFMDCSPKNYTIFRNFRANSSLVDIGDVEQCYWIFLNRRSHGLQKTFQNFCGNLEGASVRLTKSRCLVKMYFANDETWDTPQRL